MPAKSHPTFQPTTASPRRSRWLSALGLISLAAVSAAHGQAAPGAPSAHSVLGEALAGDDHRVPDTPAAVTDVVAIQPFSLRTAFRYNWLASQPEVSSGLLVVLQVDPRYVHPTDAAEPVLYAGDRTVKRLNQGERSGFVVGIVPGEAGLETALVFFGTPELPERVTGEILAQQRELALAAGIKPFTAEQLESARLEAAYADDLTKLLAGPAADLLLKYSPDERKLAEEWRLSADSQ